MFFKKKDPAPHQDPLVALIQQNHNETKRNNLYNNFFKMFMLGYIVLLFSVNSKFKMEDVLSNGENHTAIVKLDGEISSNSAANAKDLIENLEAAFKDKQTKGVIIEANSPGGSPVQSDDVYQAIKRLRKENPETPVYAVVTDLCASGCYYIISATDKIFVNKASLIGSIGVIMKSFGAVGLIDKVGVERRVVTAGSHKSLLDPFMPSKPEEIQYLKNLTSDVHQQFIAAVKDGRGDRLGQKTKIPDDELFSGLIWTGAKGIDLGLADEEGNILHVAKDIIGAKETVEFSKPVSPFDKLGNVIGTQVSQAVTSMIKQQMATSVTLQ